MTGPSGSRDTRRRTARQSAIIGLLERARSLRAHPIEVRLCREAAETLGRREREGSGVVRGVRGGAGS